MQIRTVVSPLLGACCYVVGDPGGAGVVVDPGQGVVAEVLDLVRADRLDVRAVLVTHGHVDHTWSAGELCAALGVPLHVHHADLPRISDPFGTLGPLGAQLAAMAAASGQEYTEPAEVVTFGAGSVGEPLTLVLAGGQDGAPFTLEALHCPGHTAGSTVYLVPGEDPGAPARALTGDVLFAGSVGRTDLPGGDSAAMGATLRRLAALDPAVQVLPGHGPSSTVGREVASNPYLRPGSPFLT